MCVCLSVCVCVRVCVTVELSTSAAQACSIPVALLQPDAGPGHLLGAEVGVCSIGLGEC